MTKQPKPAVDEDRSEALRELFLLELGFRWRLHGCLASAAEVEQLHAGYAIERGYERLIKRLGPVTDQELERTKERLILYGDPRDVLSTRDSLRQILSG